MSARDCEHGYQRRKCPHCENLALDAELAASSAREARLREALRDLRAVVGQAACVIENSDATNGVSDTIWYSDAWTLVDFMRAGRERAALADPPRPVEGPDAILAEWATSEADLAGSSFLAADHQPDPASYETAYPAHNPAHCLRCGRPLVCAPCLEATSLVSAPAPRYTREEVERAIQAAQKTGRGDTWLRAFWAALTPNETTPPATPEEK